MEIVDSFKVEFEEKVHLQGVKKVVEVKHEPSLDLGIDILNYSDGKSADNQCLQINSSESEIDSESDEDMKEGTLTNTEFVIKPRSIKNYMCSVCDYRTNRSTCFKDHMLLHNGNKSYSCQTCQYKTAHKENLIKHYSFHNNAKFFACNRCYYKTSRRYSLKVHLKSHNDAARGKVYTCSVCSYTTWTKKQLNDHEIRHVRLPFLCNFCNFSSFRRSDVMKHMSVHTQKGTLLRNIRDYRAGRK